MFDCETLFAKYSNRRAIIWQNSHQQREHFNYEEIVKASKKVKCVLNEFITNNGQNNIGVLLHHSAEIVPVILGILDAGATFCCLNQKQSSNELNEMINLLRCNIGIAEEAFIQRQSGKYETLKKIKIFEKVFVILRLSTFEFVIENASPCVETENFCESSKAMFCCSTSGTTGKPKMVQVPFKCLMPNVISLSKRYEITECDTIYITSPPTFDPFVVDLFLGLYNGATILMVSNTLRLSPDLLMSSLKSNSVTIMQITPSLFRRFPTDTIQNQLLSSESTLRCLIFGGEPFPSMEEISLWLQINGDGEVQMRTRLFNVYGITEVSCWSTIYEVTLMDVHSKSAIPIGQPLDEFTSLKVIHAVNEGTIENGIGELFIESNVRQCQIHENGAPVKTSNSIATGDLVEIKSGRIFYKSRQNDMVKIFGCKVNLMKIENAVKFHWSINNACCVHVKSTNSLVLFVQLRNGQNYTTREILVGLRQKLLEHEVPNEVHFVDEFPLSCHGKISKSKLLETIEKPSTVCKRKYFVAKLEETLPSFNVETSMELPFLAAGGTSVLALQLINELELKFNLVDPELITMLLHHDITLEEISLRLRTYRPHNPISVSSEIAQTVPFDWCHDLEKCIDATPTLCTIDDKKIVSVGSHSHILLNVDLTSGHLVSKLTLPNRIECQVVQFNDHGIVGCYDGFVYCFDIRNGREKWKFNSNGMVKSKLCVVGDFVVLGNYNPEFNLWCLRADNGTLVWNRKIGEKSIYAGIIELTNQKLFISTLDGVCTVVEPKIGTSIWETKLQSPIFSTANVLGNAIFVAEVLGVVHCIDSESGKILCSYRAAGNIYSAIEVVGSNSFCFGCYDKSVYCISFQADACKLQLLWKVETSGQIFSSPKHFTYQSMSLILVCSTNGFVYVMNGNGELIKHFRIEGEIFSTPLVVENRAIIASRNNFLYCFDVCKILAESK